MSRDHIPGFPNKILKVDWSRNFPTFKDDGRKDAALHLVRFHMHIRKFKIDFPEDFMMKIFLATLEGKAQSWYEIFPPACIYCLKDFHAMFIERYEDSYPSLNLVQDCCKHAYSFIESLEKFYEDDNFMDEEIMEALYENPFQQHTEILDTCQDQQVEDGHMAENDEREGSISDLPTEEDSMQGNQVSSSEGDKVRSAISNLDSDRDEEDNLVLNPIKESSVVEIIWYEEEKVIDQSLREEVIQPAHEKQDEMFVQVSEKSSFNHDLDSLIAMSYEDDRQCFQVSEDQDCHSEFQEAKTCLSKRKPKILSPLFEEEIDQLLKGLVTAQATTDLQCTHSQESVGETSSSFANDDCLVISFVDQQKDKAVMFDHLEDCFWFKNDLEHEIERDNMIKEFTVNTHMAEVYTSLCLPINQQPIVLSDQNEASTYSFDVGSQDEIVLQDYQDPFGILLQALEKINIAWFIIISFGFSGCFELPTGSSFCLLEISERKNLVCSHLLDWLHWKAHYT